MQRNFNRAGAFVQKKRRPCPQSALARSSACLQVRIVGRDNFHWRVAIISQLRRVTRDDDWRNTDVVLFISREEGEGEGGREIGIHWSYNRGESVRVYFHVPCSCPAIAARGLPHGSPTNRVVIHASPIKVITRLIIRALREQEQDSRAS